MAANWQPQSTTASTQTNDLDIGQARWMVSVEDMDDDDDARDSIFATIGTTNDVFGLFDD